MEHSFPKSGRFMEMARGLDSEGMWTQFDILGA